MTIVLFIVVLAILILTHELGHFITAKMSGIRVDEFGLGLPPKVFGIKKGETTYSINWLPFGGFVKIFGEDPNEENISGPDSARSLVNKPKRVQALVLSAGVALNFVLGWILISTNLLIGMPVATEGLPASLNIRDQQLTIVNVLKDSPAEKAGLKTGDRLISLSTGQERIKDLTADSVKNFVKDKGGQKVALEYARHGEPEKIIEIVPQTNGGNEALIGIAMERIGIASATWWQVPFYGLYFTYHLIVNTLLSFGQFFSSIMAEDRGALSAVAGPIGIYSLMSDASRLGLVYLFNFTALISINLAILNLLPFPALDGGRLLFVIIEAIIRRPIKPQVANILNTVGFGLLILLMLIIAVSDIFKLL